MKRLFLLFMICVSEVLVSSRFLTASNALVNSDSAGQPIVLIDEEFFEHSNLAVSDGAVDTESVETTTQNVEEVVNDIPAVEAVVTGVATVEEAPVAEVVAVEDAPVVEVAPIEVAPVEVAPVEEVPVEVAPVEVVSQASVTVSNSITIAGRTINIVDVDSTLVDSGDHVNHFGEKFYYGHNSAAVFGGIVNIGVGDTFSITSGGVTKTYRVVETVIYEKNTANGLLQLDGEGDYMWYVSKARIGKKRFDVSLMTCYGTSYGNGDASHRFVIFANEI